MVHMHSMTTLYDHPFVDVIKHYEGWFSHPYLCPAGKWTIGWGYLCHAGHEPITKEGLGTTYLKDDLTVALRSLENLIPNLLTGPSHRCVAMLSWVFNLGEDNLASSTLLKRLHEEDWQAAAKEMRRWNKATGPDGVKRVLKGLVKRRESEAHLFLTGEVKIF